MAARRFTTVTYRISFRVRQRRRTDEERRDDATRTNIDRSSEESNFRPLICSFRLWGRIWDDCKMWRVTFVPWLPAVQTCGGEHRFGRTTETRKGAPCKMNEWATRPKSPACTARRQNKTRSSPTMAGGRNVAVSADGSGGSLRVIFVVVARK